MLPICRGIVFFYGYLVDSMASVSDVPYVAWKKKSNLCGPLRIPVVFNHERLVLMCEPSQKHLFGHKKEVLRPDMTPHLRSIF